VSEKLTDKQKRFCEEYVIDWNATRSAIAAGYSEKTAKEIGSENLTKPNIAKYIEEIQKDIKKLAGVSALGNILMLKDIAEDDSAKHSDKIKAVEVINKMLPDFNATVKTDNTNKNTTTVIELGNGVKPVEDD
jgi:phage terminase small subunit